MTLRDVYNSGMQDPAEPPSPASAGRRAPRSTAAAHGAPAPARAQLTPKDWIEAATAVLVDKSIDAVLVDALAKTMGVTRGSFYWHFTDRADLLARMLQSWRDAATEQVISRFEREGATARELVSELLNLPFRGRAATRTSSIEMAIRAWGRRDEMARRAVEEVDAQRLSYIAQCFSRLGYDIAEARTRAFVLYGFEFGESVLISQGTDQQREDRRAFVQRMLLSPAATGTS